MGMYVTIPIKKETTASNVISKVVKRRNINVNKVQCLLYFNGQPIKDDEDNLYKMVQSDQKKIKIAYKEIGHDASESIQFVETPQIETDDGRLNRILSADNANIVNVPSLAVPEVQRSLSAINPSSAPHLAQSASIDIENIYDNESVADHESEWKCPTCTFFNDESAEYCKICGYGKNNLHEIESKTAETVNMDIASSNALYFGSNQLQYDDMQQRLMMNYHYQAYQGIFVQLSNNASSATLSIEQVQQLQVMANYHFQQYSMSNQLIKLQNQMNNLQTVPKQQMIYVKLERYFILSQQQKNYLNANFGAIQAELSQYASIDIVDAELFGMDNCFRLIIPPNIPLPKRKNYWQNVIRICMQNIGMCLEHVL